jgi:hypothetical protein
MLQIENQVKNLKLLILKKNWRLDKLYQKYQSIYHNKYLYLKNFFMIKIIYLYMLLTLYQRVKIK